MYDTETGDIIIKTANTHNADVPVKFKVENTLSLGAEAALTIMRGADTDENSLQNKNKIVPEESVVNINAAQSENGAEFTYTLPANSFTVLRIPSVQGEISMDGGRLTGTAAGNGAHALIAICYDANGALSGVYSTEKAAGALTLDISESYDKIKAYMIDENNNIIAGL